MPQWDFVEQTLRNLIAESLSFGYTRHSLYRRSAAALSMPAFLNAARQLGSVQAICNGLILDGVNLQWFGAQPSPLPAYVNCLPPEGAGAVKVARDRLRPILQAIDREQALVLRLQGRALPAWLAANTAEIDAHIASVIDAWIAQHLPEPFQRDSTIKARLRATLADVARKHDFTEPLFLRAHRAWRSELAASLLACCHGSYAWTRSLENMLIGHADAIRAAIDKDMGLSLDPRAAVEETLLEIHRVLHADPPPNLSPSAGQAQALSRLKLALLRAVTDAIAPEYGPDEIDRRLAEPYVRGTPAATFRQALVDAFLDALGPADPLTPRSGGPTRPPRQPAADPPQAIVECVQRLTGRLDRTLPVPANVRIPASTRRLLAHATPAALHATRRRGRQLASLTDAELLQLATANLREQLEGIRASVVDDLTRWLHATKSPEEWAAYNAPYATISDPKAPSEARDLASELQKLAARLLAVRMAAIGLRVADRNTGPFQHHEHLDEQFQLIGWIASGVWRAWADTSPRRIDLGPLPEVVKKLLGPLAAATNVEAFVDGLVVEGVQHGLDFRQVPDTRDLLWATYLIATLVQHASPDAAALRLFNNPVQEVGAVLGPLAEQHAPRKRIDVWVREVTAVGIRHGIFRALPPTRGGVNLAWAAYVVRTLAQGECPRTAALTLAGQTGAAYATLAAVDPEAIRSGSGSRDQRIERWFRSIAGANVLHRLDARAASGLKALALAYLVETYVNGKPDAQAAQAIGADPKHHQGRMYRYALMATNTIRIRLMVRASALIFKARP